jgi:hypothetical protein
MKAGTYDFELTNAGKEFHVMVIATRKPGVTESFDELIQDPAGDSKVITVGANGAEPGGSASIIAKLEPGEYLVVCPIPLGSTAAGAARDRGAPLHGRHAPDDHRDGLTTVCISATPSRPLLTLRTGPVVVPAAVAPDTAGTRRVGVAGVRSGRTGRGGNRHALSPTSCSVKW